MVVLAFVFMAINSNKTQQAQNAPRENSIAEAADSSRLEEELFARSSRPPEAAATVVRAAPQPQAKPQIVLVRPQAAVQTPKPQAKPRPVITESQIELARRYREMRSNAVLSTSAIDGFTETSAAAPQTRAANSQRALLESQAYAAANAANAEALPPEVLQALMPQTAQDSNGQGGKLQFLTQDGAARTPHGYSEHTRMPQVTKLELKAGTVIPGLLLTGLNSDLPGTIIGQVSENVYDSATGKYLLIPQGSRILGVYDSRTQLSQPERGINFSNGAGNVAVKYSIQALSASFPLGENSLKKTSNTWNIFRKILTCTVDMTRL